ncbi:hypothetical protein CTI12_AA073620 [Artemisia annua]|uniref:Uncharacterized protein n=1 Tax=Artemisia annua TaxID=35608 RepID=A0A2U1Q5B3_ARTAN|nr:hypothetical protein CTI12_AA073620 [Artemisia annua]
MFLRLLHDEDQSLILLRSYGRLLAWFQWFNTMRSDAEGSVLKEKLDGMESSRELIGDGYEKASKEATIATIEALKKALAHIQVCSRLEALLLKKRVLCSGETPEVHAQKELGSSYQINGLAIVRIGQKSYNSGNGKYSM